MRQLAGSLCSLGLSFSALCTAVLAEAKPEVSTPDAVVFRTSAAAGEQHFAVAIRAAGVPAEIKRHVILVDTSASQMGKFREGSLQLLSALIERLPAGHSVMVAAVDSDFQSLTAGFVPTGSAELEKSVKSLSARTPMGATDLASALRESFAQDSASPMSVLYIGDGMSAADQLSLKTLDSLVDDLIGQSISFHALLLGPKVDTELPGILANQTGGTFEYPENLDANSSASRLAEQLSAAPVFVKNVAVDGKGLSLATAETVALRADRHTVLFGKGSPSNQVSVSGISSSGEKLTWSADPQQVKDAGQEVHVLFDRAAASHGLNSAVVGLEGLTATSRQFESAINESISVAELLKGRGQSAKALEVARRGLLLDASNSILTGMVKTLQDETVAGTADDRLGPPSVDEGGALQKSEARGEILTQQLVQSAKAAIDEANRVAGENPDYALTLLKDLLDTIRQSRDVAPEKREELERRVTEAYSRVNSARQTNEIRNREESEIRANKEATSKLLQESQVEEERLRTLISQVAGLLNKARHGDIAAYEDAEIAARTALDMRPGNGPASAAVVMAEASGQLSKAYTLRNLRHDRFLETLYQVELSHVPFPDEPPIQYPPADVWRALTLSRKKQYESVSLRSEKPVELWLEEMLDQPIPALNYPGENSLGDILKYLSDYYTELGPYTMRIILDELDPDIGTDAAFLETTQVADVDLKGITLRNALKLIFAKVKDQDPGLTFMIKNEVMMVTTTDTANSEENLVIRVYQVGDLVVPTVSQGGQGGQQGGQGGGQGGGGFGGGQGGGGQGGGGFGGGGGQFSVSDQPVNSPKNGINLKGTSVKKKPMK